MPRSNLHVDTVLTDFAVAYMRSSDTYIAGQALDPLPVQHQSNLFQVWSQADFGRDEAKLRAPGAPAAETEVSMSTAPYFCNVYALKGKSIDRDRDNSDDPVGYDQGITASVIDPLLLRRERLFLSTILTAANWPSSNRMSGTTAVPAYAQTFLRWDQTNSDPVATMNYAHLLARQGTNGRRANVMVVAPGVHDVLLQHTAIRGLIQYGGVLTNPAVLNGGYNASVYKVMAAIFGVEKYLVPFSSYNTALQNQTATISDVATNQVALFYAPTGAGKMTPSAVKCFSWSPYDQAKGPNQVSVKRYRAEDIESDWLESQFAVDFRITASSAGVILSSVAA